MRWSEFISYDIHKGIQKKIIILLGSITHFPKFFANFSDWIIRRIYIIHNVENEIRIYFYW